MSSPKTLTTDFVPIPLPDYQEYDLNEMRARAQEFYDDIKTRHTVRDFRIVLSRVTSSKPAFVLPALRRTGPTTSPGIFP